MHVRPRTEIVALGLEDDVDPRVTTGKYYSPKEFKEALEDEDTVILDARNDYEFDLGHFRGAIRPDITRFRDLPDWIRNNKDQLDLSLIHISEPTRREWLSRMPSSA